MATEMILDPFSEDDFTDGGSLEADLSTLTIHRGPVYSVAVVKVRLRNCMEGFFSLSFRRDEGRIDSRRLWPLVSATGEPANEETLRRFVHGYARILCRTDADGNEIGREDDGEGGDAS